jgi:hypothetical protein
MNPIQTAPKANFTVNLNGVDTLAQLIEGGIEPSTVKWRLSDPKFGSCQVDPISLVSAEVTVSEVTGPFAVTFSARSTDGRDLYGILPYVSVGQDTELIGLNYREGIEAPVEITPELPAAEPVATEIISDVTAQEEEEDLATVAEQPVEYAWSDNKDTSLDV